jgi:hypothetical protein
MITEPVVPCRRTVMTFIAGARLHLPAGASAAQEQVSAAREQARRRVPHKLMNLSRSRGSCTHLGVAATGAS